MRHGFWSALVDLGANTSVTRCRHLNLAATTIAMVTTAGFLLGRHHCLDGEPEK